MAIKFKDYYRGFEIPCKPTASEIWDGLAVVKHWCPAIAQSDPSTEVCKDTRCENCLFMNIDVNRKALSSALESGIFPETHTEREVDPETEDADLDALASDPVSHPAHYCVGGVECIDVMERVFGTEAVKTFCRLNAFKYLFRSENKNGRQDIDKVHWYTGKYGELCDKVPVLPLQEQDYEDRVKSAILRLVDTAQEEARKDCEPTPAVWDAVDNLYEVLGIDNEDEEDDE